MEENNGNVVYLTQTRYKQTGMENIQMPSVLATVKAIESRLPKSLDEMSNKELIDNLAVDNWAQKAGEVLCIGEAETVKNAKIMENFFD